MSCDFLVTLKLIDGRNGVAMGPRHTYEIGHGRDLRLSPESLATWLGSTNSIGNSLGLDVKQALPEDLRICFDVDNGKLIVCAYLADAKLQELPCTVEIDGHRVIYHPANRRQALYPRHTQHHLQIGDLHFYLHVALAQTSDSMPPDHARPH